MVHGTHMDLQLTVVLVNAQVDDTADDSSPAAAAAAATPLDARHSRRARTTAANGAAAAADRAGALTELTWEVFEALWVKLANAATRSKLGGAHIVYQVRLD
jgi:hypothetical protein